ncbi:MAG: 50S ribosomal protein L21 [Planctomycetota bacterium]|nr:50S ribosomal protein L21 [Planctomycetota bacterium]
MYAIINDRGRQYKVREGELLRVDLLPLEKGAAVVFDKVLLVGKDGGLKVGAPTVAGAKVTGVLENQAKGLKTVAYRRIQTNRHKVRTGHRTQYSLVKIGKIEG